MECRAGGNFYDSKRSVRKGTYPEQPEPQLGVLSPDRRLRARRRSCPKPELDDEDHPVAYYSRKFLPAEKNYSAVEQECLAVVNGIAHFDVYVSGREFTVETDNRALVYLQNFKDTKSRLVRWALALQPYQFKVVHRAGTKNGNADGLSRQFSDGTTPTFREEGESVREPNPDSLSFPTTPTPPRYLQPQPPQIRDVRGHSTAKRVDDSKTV